MARDQRSHVECHQAPSAPDGAGMQSSQAHGDQTCHPSFKELAKLLARQAAREYQRSEREE